MKDIKRATRAPTQLVLPYLNNLRISQEKKKDSWLFDKKKKIKKKKSKSRKSGYNTKGKKRNKRSKK